jgi:hypothetical protein
MSYHVLLPTTELPVQTALGGSKKARRSYLHPSIARPIESRKGARFENSEALDTIGPDLTLSFQSQSLPEDSEVGMEPSKSDRTR